MFPRIAELLFLNLSDSCNIRVTTILLRKGWLCCLPGPTKVYACALPLLFLPSLPVLRLSS